MGQPTVVSVDRWSLYRGELVSLGWLMGQPKVVSVDRWSLYRGELVSLGWLMGQPKVVSVDRWSLYTGFRAQPFAHSLGPLVSFKREFPLSHSHCTVV